MAQLRLLLCSPYPSPLSFSQTPPPLVLCPNSTFPSRIPSLSLPSFQPTFTSPPWLSLLLRPLFSSSASAVDVSEEATSVESETEELSRTRLLAQNVPWTSTADDIRALFEKHGTVVHVELSMHNKTRNRGLAFVEMGSPEEATAALNKLEGYEFVGRSLRVNYAKPKTKKPSASVQAKQPLSFNLFVANLSFAARSEDLRAFFSSEGYKVVSAGVVFQGNPRKSAGYGFVSFATKREADAALSYFQGKELLGRPMQLARSKRFVKVVREANSEPEAAASEPETILQRVEESKGDL